MVRVGCFWCNELGSTCQFVRLSSSNVMTLGQVVKLLCKDLCYIVSQADVESMDEMK